MERRLLPLNGVLALLDGRGGGKAWPNDLAAQGYRLHLIEADVQSTPQSVRADVVAYRLDPPLILLFECKSGCNISAGQARGYCNATLDGLRRRTSIPAALSSVSETSVAAVFVGLDEDEQALAESMTREQIEAPLLVVGATGARLRGSHVDGLQDFERRDARYGEPPGRILVDQDSPMDEIRELLAQQVAAAFSRGSQELGLDDAASLIHPYWASVARPAQQVFMQRLKEAAQSLARSDMRQDLRYESSNAISPRLVLTSGLAQADPRGAPQAWQALGRRAERSIGRKPRPQIEGQTAMSFDELDPEGVDEDDAS